MKKLLIGTLLAFPSFAFAQAYYPDVKTQMQNQIVESFARGMEQGLNHSTQSPMTDQFFEQQRRQQWLREQMWLEEYKAKLRRQEELNRQYAPQQQRSINCYTIGPWTNCQ